MLPHILFAAMFLLLVPILALPTLVALFIYFYSRKYILRDIKNCSKRVMEQAKLGMRYESTGARCDTRQASDISRARVLLIKRPVVLDS